MTRFPLFGVLFAAFTGFALVELILLIWLAANTSFLFTLGLILLTGLVGAALARTQGTQVLRQVMNELSTGRLPAMAMLEGVIILIGGAFLLTPGLITDCVGISALIPQCRRFYIRAARKRLARHFRVIDLSGSRPPHAPRGAADDDVIDVEFKRED